MPRNRLQRRKIALARPVMTVTRTLNPLPFEHLEPKRFEDLVRQLIYDFRPWRRLEATGRSGGDEGFDARAIEAIGAQPAAGEDEGDDAEPEDVRERIWLIQCKREKAIGPTQIEKHLDAIPAESIVGLYGLVFAAACDFSKRTRDACLAWCRERGIQEVHIWGRGEIEDQLFQPKNDNLLFAYFGISLQIRRQSIATTIRRTTSLKRKIRRITEKGGRYGTPIVIRDPGDARYPDIELAAWDREEFLWRPVNALGAGPHGLEVVWRHFLAFVDPATGEWDFATGYNSVYPHEATNMWPAPEPLERHEEETRRFWWNLPDECQQHFKLIVWLPYREIIEIDDVGDSFCDMPTVFATFRDGKPPFLERCDIRLEGSRSSFDAEWRPDRHVRIFPDHLRNEDWEREWMAKNSHKLGPRRSAPTREPPPQE